MDNFGNWIDDGFKIGIHEDALPVYKCKFCQKRIFVLPISQNTRANYCPNCGKDMEVSNADTKKVLKNG